MSPTAPAAEDRADRLGAADSGKCHADCGRDARGPPVLDAAGAIGLPGTLYLYRDRVRIVAGRFSADHERQTQPGASSILPEHRAQRVAAVSGKRARRYLQRQHLLDLGAAALAYLTELTHRRPRTWIPEVERLHAL
jgi:hypothetical protein